MDLLKRRRLLMGRGETDPAKMPLTFIVVGPDAGNAIGWKASGSSYVQTIEYSRNGGPWTSITSTTSASGAVIPSTVGDVIRVRGTSFPAAGRTNQSYFTTPNNHSTVIVLGNPASLKYGDVLTGEETLDSYAFCRLFYSCSHLISAKDLFLGHPQASDCYYQMFMNCSSLEEAPALPSTSLADYSYMYMFSGCTSLVEAPELPATSVASSYYGMFSGCTSLTKAPELPATTITGRYQEMFMGCTSLKTAPALPATSLPEHVYNSMFYGCTSLTKAPELPATSLSTSCYRSMFQGCTSLIEAPDLPAITLAQYCYYSMFQGCTSLILAPELEAPTLALYCYYRMFYGCSQLGQIICPATNISANYALSDWLNGVAAQGTFYKRAGVTWPSGDSGIPSGWTILEV